jgi:hypothetical protein
MQPEVSHDRAEPFGIDVGVARWRCNALMLSILKAMLGYTVENAPIVPRIPLRVAVSIPGGR